MVWIRKKKVWSFLLTLYHTIPTFNTWEKKAFENSFGKGENAGNQQFLFFQHFFPFPAMFSILPNPNFNFWIIIILSSASNLNMEKSKIKLFGKELTHYETTKF